MFFVPIALDASWKTCTWNAPLRTQVTKYNIVDFTHWEAQLCCSKMRLSSGI